MVPPLSQLAGLRVIRISEMTTSQKEDLIERSRKELATAIPISRRIIREVRKRGDAGIRWAAHRYAPFVQPGDLRTLLVSDDEIARAHENVSPAAKKILGDAIKTIGAFHSAQVQPDSSVETIAGVRVGRTSRPIERVGLYVPRGLVSSVLMLGVPSGLAGCPTRILCVPPTHDGLIPDAILVAATLVGIRSIYKVGGAQAIAALAHGTESVPRVDKIFGAGNRWVNAAKLIVRGDWTIQVDIDLPAGPSENFILADESASPKYVAADALAQAEHDADSATVVVTTSELLAREIVREMDHQYETVGHSDNIEKSLSKYGYIVVAASLEEGIELINEFVPEHVQLLVQEPNSYASHIKHAGSIFIGPFSPVPAGDYASGGNHVLPTWGFGRMFSAVSWDSFITRPQYQELTREGLGRLRKIVGLMADIEGLPAHRNAVEVRFEDSDGSAST